MGRDLGTTAFAQHDDEFNGHYRGQVMNNVDPLQRGRIQVQVLPMLVSVATADLPWAIPANLIWGGAGNSFGSFQVPAIGSWVWTFFEMGSIYQPVYFAEASDAVHGIPVESQTNYPNRKVLKSASGVTIYVDDTTKTIVLKTPGGLQGKLDDTTNTITLTQSSSGSYIEIDQLGQVDIQCLNINVYTTESGGSGGNGTLNISGNITLNVNGTTALNSTGVTTIVGSAVHINPEE